MKITSPAFSQGGDIPAKYTCLGDNISPPLEIGGVPQNAASLVLIMDDYDAALEPGGWGRTFDHWLVANIDPKTERVEEGEVPTGGVEITNHFGQTAYGGPCPPSFKHIYTIRLYALSGVLDAAGLNGKEDLLKAMGGQVVDSALLWAYFTK